MRSTRMVKEFAALLLPAARLVWRLVETLPPTAAGSSSSSSVQARPLSAGVPAAAVASDADKQLLLLATQFGTYAVCLLGADSAVAFPAEAACSDELAQVLLLYLACTAACTRQLQTNARFAATASGGNSSRSDRGSSSSSRRSSSSAAQASSSQGSTDVPPHHMALLSALAPVLQQPPIFPAGLEEHVQQLAALAAPSLSVVSGFLVLRTQLLQHSQAPPAAAAAAASSSSSSAAAPLGGMLPRDELLLPLLLTIVELAALQPPRRAALLPAAGSFMVALLNEQCEQLMPSAATASASAAAAPVPAAAAAVADALVEPVLLQLAPAVAAYLGGGGAAAATPAAGSSADAEAAERDERLAISYLLLVVVVLQHGSRESLLGSFRRNPLAADAALEAAVRLAAGGSPRQRVMGSVLQPELFECMRHVHGIRVAPAGGADVPSAAAAVSWQPSSSSSSSSPAAAVSWQPSLLLSLLNAASKGLRDGTAAAVAVLHDAMRTASHAGTARVQLAITLTAIAPDQDRPTLLLLYGRALHVAAAALLQLHEPTVPAAAAAAAAAAYVRQLLLQQQPDVSLVANASVVLQGLWAAVVAIGGLLPAADGACRSGSTPQHIADLQQLQQRLQQQLEVDVVPTGYSLHSGGQVLDSIHDWEVLLKQLFPPEFVKLLLQLATGACTQLAPPGPLCCANPSCTSCAKLSEQELVAGKGTVCSGCHAVRLCSAECNKAYWKAGHKQACSRLKKAAGQQQHGGRSSQASSSRRAVAGLSTRR
uniref:MYND-type domain-containing protein n=1 Tax=Tetradesmus obliquus TaxID=3088 RepID=A0A383VF56_TETOB|eukprot:jgi/Sobl393_1/15896/SZX63811.1